MEKAFEVQPITLAWKQVISGERQWCEFVIPGSPRMILAAIDRMATKANYSVYEQMDGLRIETGSAQIRIKNEEKEFVARTEPCLPRTWMLFPLVIAGTGLLIGSWYGPVVGLPLAAFVFLRLNEMSKKKGAQQIEVFKEQLAEVLRKECAVAVFSTTHVA